MADIKGAKEKWTKDQPHKTIRDCRAFDSFFFLKWMTVINKGHYNICYHFIPLQVVWQWLWQSSLSSWSQLSSKCSRCFLKAFKVLFIQQFLISMFMSKVVVSVISIVQMTIQNPDVIFQPISNWKWMTQLGPWVFTFFTLQSCVESRCFPCGVTEIDFLSPWFGWGYTSFCQMADCGLNTKR